MSIIIIAHFLVKNPRPKWTKKVAYCPWNDARDLNNDVPGGIIQK